MTVSAIEWTDEVWNPVTGCTRVSPGCAHCYIERTPPFRMQGRRFARVGNEETTGVRLHPERLEVPLRTRKPTTWFVNSLSDLFHEDVPYEYVRDVFNVMRRCDGGLVAATGRREPAHTFQVLTKRPERALELWRDRKLGFVDWPPHVWLGVSIENARYTWRADVLREIPAAVRFISAEPLLGSLYSKESHGHPARSSLGSAVPDRGGDAGTCDAGRPEHLEVREAAAVRAGGSDGDLRAAGRTRDRLGAAPLDLTGIDWLIVGGESGPGARPMHPDWARELRDECVVPCAWCRGEGVREYAVDLRHGSPVRYETRECDACHGRRAAFFFKQWGHHAPWIDGTSSGGYPYVTLADGTRMAVMGKKAAGRELDGHTWDEMPDLERVA